MNLRDRLRDMVCGRPLTLRKWSVQISLWEAPVMGFLGAAWQVLPQWVLPVAYIVFWLARMGAANMTQASIASYDPRTQGLYDLATQKVMDA